VEERFAGRTFPSICASGASAERLCAFDGAETPLNESPMTTLARHDLLMLPPESCGLRWEGRFAGDATALTAESAAKGQLWRSELMRLNPHAIVLADIPYDSVPVDRLPMSSPLWRRAANGHIDTAITVSGTRGRIKFESSTFLKLFQKQIGALLASGVVDGIVLRSWQDKLPASLALVQAARRGVGREGVILLGSGVAPPVRTGAYANGILVVDDPREKPVWPLLAGITAWANTYLRKPGFTVLESIAPRTRLQLYDMRMATTMALAFGDGYVTFEDGSGHDWYEMWAPNLGRPTGSAYRKDGAFRREFQNGLVVFNPPINRTVYVEFSSAHTSTAKSLSTRRVSVQPGDGDILLAKPPEH